MFVDLVEETFPTYGRNAKFRRFIAGIVPYLYVACHKQDITTLDAALQFAIQIENAHQARRVFSALNNLLSFSQALFSSAEAGLSILWHQSKLSLGASPSLPVLTILALPHTLVSATVLCHYKGGLQIQPHDLFSCKLNRRVKYIYLPFSSSCCNPNLTILALTSAKALIMSSIFNYLWTQIAIQLQQILLVDVIQHFCWKRNVTWKSNDSCPQF